MDGDDDVRTATLALIEQLTALTRSGGVKWDYQESLSLARGTHRGVDYILDFPRGETILLVDGVMVWKGYGLEPLRAAVLDQQRPSSAPTQQGLLDYRTIETVARALKTLDSENA